jgi:Bax protein
MILPLIALTSFSSYSFIQKSVPPEYKSGVELTEYKASFINFSKFALGNSMRFIDINRTRLISISEKDSLSISDRDYIKSMSEKYGLENADIKELLERVNLIPLGMATGLIIHKTTWGTNSVLMDLNNPFGVELNGQLKQYKSIEDGIEAYIELLNTSPDYKSFRDARAQLMKQNDSLKTEKLLHLIIDKNSTDYKEVLSIISNENLLYLD